MKKIGRNDPCPCNSGKKYKLCCIDRPIESVREDAFRQLSENFHSYDRASQLTTEEIISSLHAVGIPFEKQSFLRDVSVLFSARQVAQRWLKSLPFVPGHGEPLSIAAQVLWDRLAPESVMSMERMMVLIEDGYRHLNEKNPKTACDLWLHVWDAIKERHKPKFKSLEYLDEQYREAFFISNFCQDLEVSLYSAGVQDADYFHKQIAYCQEFCRLFPEESELIIHNMRRAIIDSYIALEDFASAIAESDRLVMDYPDNPWSYIQYADMYFFGDEDRKDLKKAKDLYHEAFLRAIENYDKEAIWERLEDLMVIR